MTSNKGYLYTNGVISSLSNNLIKKDTFNKIIETNNLDNVVAMLSNTSFAKNKKINSFLEINKFLDIELFNLNTFLKKECPENTFVDFICCFYDYNNIENLYKSKLFNFEFNEKKFIEGNYSFSKIKECLNLNNFNGLNNFFIKELFIKLDLIKDKLNELSKIDLYFKLYLYKNLYEIVKRNKVLTKILQYKIDFQNIMLFVRVSSFEAFEIEYLNNGTLELSNFKNAFLNKNISNLKNDKIIDKWIKIIGRGNTHEKLVNFNKESKLIELEVLAAYKEDIESIIPFLKYYYKKRLEINNLRMIFSLKFNNLNSYVKDKYLEE